MDLNEAKELLEENGYIIDEGIFDSIKNKFFKKKEDTTEVKPVNKKLYNDQIEKTSQQAYNHTTESMSTLKQVATNFNGKNAGELKQLWSGLSKLLNKHGMSAKNHDYYLGVTNNNTKFSVLAYIAYPEKDWTDIKIIGTVKANVFEYKYTTNYDLDDSSLKGQADDLNEWLTELDSIALKLFKGVSREEWEEDAYQNESVNKAIKLLESVGYIVEDTEEEISEAVKILANLHYQICNGGWEQACYNGYVDELNNYGVKKWEKDLETEFAKSPLLKKVKKVIELIKSAMEQTVMVRNCPDCNGAGSWEETEEDEDGYEESHTEYCDKCDGDGVVGVKTYDRVDFGSGTANDWADAWDSNYYEQVDSDTINDITKQSHTHSVVLDTIRGK